MAIDLNDPNSITWITSISQKRFDELIYNKCLKTWNNIPGKKVLFSEGEINLQGFDFVDLNKIINKEYLSSIKGLTYTRIYKKAFATYWALKNINSKLIVWLDADVYVNKPLDVFPEVSSPWGSMFFDHPGKLLGRYDQGIETGFVYFDMEKLDKNFADDYINFWHNKTIEKLHRPKDTYVLMEMALKQKHGNIAKDSSSLPAGENAFSRTILKDYFTHYIGAGNKK